MPAGPLPRRALVALAAGIALVGSAGITGDLVAPSLPSSAAGASAPALASFSVRPATAAAPHAVRTAIRPVSKHRHHGHGTRRAARRRQARSVVGAARDRAAPWGAVGVAGTHLTLHGVDHDFVGVNAYELGTVWGDNAGCGGMETTAQLDQLFASLPPASLVRVAAEQGTIGTNVTTHRLDWTGLDRVMAAAARYHQYVILTLGSQGGTCDGSVWQDPAWYSGGWRQVQDPTGRTPLSYQSYVRAIVAHFRSSPALAMWEPISEPAASDCPGGDVNGVCEGGQTCPDEATAATALREFFDTVGGMIHTVDPAHAVEDGILGGGQCGTAGADWSYVSRSPGIDVLSYHDYYSGAALGGDQWNGIAVRLAQARSVTKPVIAGEIGLEASSDGGGCPDLGQRAAEDQAKIDAQLGGGAAGALLWNYEWDASPPGTCSENINPGDPALAVLTRALRQFG